MLTFDEVENHSKAYSNLTIDELGEARTDDLHRFLSQRVSALDEVTDTKKSFNGSANDLLKKIRSDIQSINREIRGRLPADPQQEGGEVQDVTAIDVVG